MAETTLTELLEKWESADPRIRDAEVAARVVGWRFKPMSEGIAPHEATMCWLPPGEQYRATELPHFTTDPAADYAVLARVREKWEDNQKYEFAKALQEIWNARYLGVGLSMRYMPGDYAKAALTALTPLTPKG